jgi:steroid delta-isomerase-like uncharacterized protein
MSDDRKAIVRRWIHQLWDKDDISIFNDNATEDYVYTAPGIGPLHGRAELESFLRDLRPAIPDRRNTIEEQFAEGDTVITCGTARGTHTGNWHSLPPTGGTIQLPWILVTRFRGNKIAEEREMFDSLAFMERIGAVKRD